MIFCDEAIVLRQRPFKESDVISSLYTKNYGRMDAVFKSVKLSKAKLKALGEVLTFGDYRLYHKNESRLTICVGGSVLSIFQNIRKETSKMFLSFYFCEVLFYLTPLNQPSEEKFNLILSALRYLESNEVFSWMKKAFMLRFMDMAGYGFRKTSVGIDSRVWDVWHDGEWADVSKMGLLPELEGRVDKLISDFTAAHLKRPLETEKFTN